MNGPQRRGQQFFEENRRRREQQMNTVATGPNVGGVAWNRYSGVNPMQDAENYRNQRAAIDAQNLANRAPKAEVESEEEEEEEKKYAWYNHDDNDYGAMRGLGLYGEHNNDPAMPYVLDPVALERRADIMNTYEYRHIGDDEEDLLTNPQDLIDELKTGYDQIPEDIRRANERMVHRLLPRYYEPNYYQDVRHNDRVWMMPRPVVDDGTMDGSVTQVGSRYVYNDMDIANRNQPMPNRYGDTAELAVRGAYIDTMRTRQPAYNFEHLADQTVRATLQQTGMYPYTNAQAGAVIAQRRAERDQQ
jgi:hypothetical protein